MIPINISSQSSVSKENPSGSIEVTAHDYAGQTPGCMGNSSSAGVPGKDLSGNQGDKN